MTDKVEKVAKALFRAFVSDQGPDPEFPSHPMVQMTDLEDVLLDGHFDLKRAARAAIEAMKDDAA